MIPLPKGVKLPDGMSFKEMQEAMKIPTECTKLVGDLISLDDDLGHVVKVFILTNDDVYPILADGIKKGVTHHD